MTSDLGGRRRAGGRNPAVRAALVLLAALVGCQTLDLKAALVPVAPEVPPAPPLTMAWQRDAQAAFGPEAVALAAGRLVVGTRQGEVVVIETETGRVAAAASFGDAVNGRPDLSADGQILFVPVSKGRAGVIAHNVRTGREAWRWGRAPVTGLRRVGEGLVATLYDGRVAGLDAASGAERWVLPAVGGGQLHAEPVAVGADRVLVADDRGLVRLLDAASGGVVWEVALGEPVRATPTVAEGAVAVSTARGRLVVLDAATGAERWARHDRGEDVKLTSAAVSAGRLAVAGTDGRVTALRLADGAEVWSVRLDPAVTAAPLWGERVLYVGTLDDRLLALDAASGATVWSDTLRGRIKTALVAADGALVVLSEPRHVAAWRPEGAGR